MAVRELWVEGYRSIRTLRLPLAPVTVVVGPNGCGKTHLAVALGIKAVEAGYSALFVTLETLMTRLVRAKHENRLERSLQQLTYPKLLIVDEIGYLPLTREEASLFFRLVVRRYERASLVVTSNKSFLDWGEVFNDHVLATAVLDRLLHHATTLNVSASSHVESTTLESAQPNAATMIASGTTRPGPPRSISPPASGWIMPKTSSPSAATSPICARLELSACSQG